MCEYLDTCKAANTYSVHSRHKISHPGNPDVNVSPFKSGITTRACGNHIRDAIKYVNGRQLNDDGLTMSNKLDGVTVKVV